MEENNLLYPGSRAEWILKRATDFDAKARNFRCVGCGQLAKWVCLDAACINYNQNKALCLCDICDAHFHMTSSPVMQNHRRLAPVLYISLLMLHRYRTFNDVLPDTPVSHGEKRPHSPDEDAADVSSSKRLSPPYTPPGATTMEMKPLKIATTIPCIGYLPPVEIPRYSSPENTSPPEMGAGRNQKNNYSSGIEYRATFGNNLRPIHARYARILQHLSDDSSLALSEAFRRESFAKLTVKNYLGIAEMKLVASDEYEALLEAYKSRGKALITVSGLERECRRALAQRSHVVSQMRKTGQLLPFFDITYHTDMESYQNGGLC